MIGTKETPVETTRTLIERAILERALLEKAIDKSKQVRESVATQLMELKIRKLAVIRKFDKKD